MNFAHSPRISISLPIAFARFAVDPLTFVKCAPCAEYAPMTAATTIDGTTNQVSVRARAAFACTRVLTWLFAWCCEQLVVCQNRRAGKTLFDMERSMAHELLHTYDFCRAEVDFTNCRHHACTEVCAQLCFSLMCHSR